MSAALKVAQRNIASFATRLDDIGDMATKAGQKLLPLTAAVTGLGFFAIKAASDFESSFAGVRKTVDATEGEFAALEAEFRSLAKAIPVNVNELNRIAEAGGQLGVAKDDIAGFTRTMADMGVATNLSSDQAAEGLAQIANIMNNDLGPQFDRMGSTIVDLGNKSAATESQILEFGLRLAGAGKVAGLSEPEILGIGSALASVGINAEAGGTAFSKVFIELASAAARGGKDLDEFAKVAGQSAAEFKRSFDTDAAGAVVSFVEGLGKVEQEGGNLFLTLEKIGVSEQRMRDALLRSAGAGDLLAESIRNGKQAWQDNNALTIEAEKRYATFASQVQILWNRVKDVAITVGTSLLPTLRDLIGLAQPVLNFAAGAAQRFAEMPMPVRATALAIFALAAAAAPALIAFGALVKVAGVAGTGVAALAGLFGASTVAATANTVALTANAVATTAVSKATKFAAGEQLAFNFMAKEGAQLLLPLSGNMAMSTVAMKTAGTAAATSGGMFSSFFGVLKGGGAVVSLLGRALALFAGPAGWIIGGAAALVTASGAWGELFRVFKALIGLQWAAFVAVWSKLWEGVSTAGGIAGGAGKSVIDFFVKLLSLQSLFDGTKEKLGQAADYVEGLASLISKALPESPKSPFEGWKTTGLAPVLDATKAQAEYVADMNKALAENELRTAAAAAAAVELSDKQKKAMANLQSATNQLTGENYRMVASFLAAGKAQGDIATAYGFTEQQVRDVAQAEEVLADHRERTRTQSMAQNEREADSAKALMDEYATGWRMTDALQKAFTDERMQRTLSSTNYALWSINEWATAEKAAFTGATEQARGFYDLVDARAKQQRDGVVMGKQMELLAHSNKMILDGFKATAALEQEIVAMRDARTLSSHNAQVKLIHEWAAAQKQGFAGTKEEAVRFYDAIDRLTTEKLKAIGESWREMFQSIPALILQTISGGGNVGEAIGAKLGMQIGDKLGVALGDKIGEAGEVLAGPLTKVFGKTVGGAISAMIPVIGPLIGSLLGKGLGAIAGWIGGLFDGGEGAKVNDLRDAFVEAEGGADQLYKRLESMGRLDMWGPLMAGPANVRLMEDAIERAEIAFARFDEAMDRAGLTMDDIGTAAEQASRNTARLADDLEILKRAGFSVETVTRGLADELNDLLSTAVDTGTQLPAAFEPYLIELMRAGLLTDELKAKMLGVDDTVDWKAMQADAEKYGISLDQLGPKFEQARLNEGLEEIAAAWKRMTDNGVEAGVLIGGMTDEVQELINKALTLGFTIPESMRPVIEAMFAAGQLTDENGVALENLSRINFAPRLESEFDRLIAKLDIFIDRLADAAGGINGLPNVPDVPGSTSSTGSQDTSNPGANPNPQYDSAHSGGMVVGSGIRRHHRGTSNVIPFPQLRHAEVPAILQTGEAVINRKAAAAMGEGQIARLNRGDIGGSAAPIHIYVTSELDGDVIARSVIRKVPDQLRRMGVAS